MATQKSPQDSGPPLPVVDRLYSVALVLSAELAITRLRLDALERLLERGSVVAREALDDFRPDPQEAAERARLQREYLDRVFRALTEESLTDAQQRKAERRRAERRNGSDQRKAG